MDATETLNSSVKTARSGAWTQALNSPLVLGLLALLGVQILAAVGLALGGRGSLTPASLDSPLFTFDPQTVTAIRIEGGSEGPVTLAKADQGWVIADLADFPGRRGQGGPAPREALRPEASPTHCHQPRGPAAPQGGRRGLRAQGHPGGRVTGPSPPCSSATPRASAGSSPGRRGSPWSTTWICHSSRSPTVGTTGWPGTTSG